MLQYIIYPRKIIDFRACLQDRLFRLSFFLFTLLCCFLGCFLCRFVHLLIFCIVFISAALFVLFLLVLLWFLLFLLICLDIFHDEIIIFVVCGGRRSRLYHGRYVFWSFRCGEQTIFVCGRGNRHIPLKLS